MLPYTESMGCTTRKIEETVDQAAYSFVSEKTKAFTSIGCDMSQRRQRI